MPWLFIYESSIILMLWIQSLYKHLHETDAPPTTHDKADILFIAFNVHTDSGLSLRNEVSMKEGK